MTKEEMAKKLLPLYEKYGETLANLEFAWNVRKYFMQEVGSVKEMRDRIIAFGTDAMIAKGKILMAQEEILEAHGVSLRERNHEMFAKAADRLRSAMLLGKQWCAANMFQYGICAAKFWNAVFCMLESSEEIREMQMKEIKALYGN